MPVPGDNGNPQKERDDQNKRITEEANHGACVREDVKFNPKCPKEKTIFGEI